MPARTHGASRSMREYKVWTAMKQRCLNPREKMYRHYGGRGISVCDDWLHSFENFLADMGERPSPLHSLDRIDNDDDYKPSNCRWATKDMQQHNRRPFNFAKKRGVYRIGDRWQARIQRSGKNYYLGTYGTIQEASAAVSAKERLLYGA